MRFVRYQYGSDAPTYGWVLGDRVGPLDGSPVGEYRRLDADTPLDRVRLLAPILPGKIICVGRNYAEHAREHDAEIPDVPLLFFKPPSSVIGPGQTVLLPPQSQRIEHEGELAVVIRKMGRWIAAEQAEDYILGYTAANDITARDLQRRDGQWTRAKGFDTFCPLGPWIETELEIADVLITCRVNGEMRQMASSREMVFTIPQLIAFASSVMTLMPGDVLLTGTPAGVGSLEEGDSVEVDIEGVGVLKNPVRKDAGRFI
jgi:2-keto-4-pentenoate hydratase/2-oxohepta-3-ene-1,7-dioic acid hydratase in catechol pathway